MVAKCTDDELAASDGLYGSSSDLAVELIGRLLFLSGNVVSVETAATGVDVQIALGMSFLEHEVASSTAVPQDDTVPDTSAPESTPPQSAPPEETSSTDGAGAVAGVG